MVPEDIGNNTFTFNIYEWKMAKACVAAIATWIIQSSGKSTKVIPHVVCSAFRVVQTIQSTRRIRSRNFTANDLYYHVKTLQIILENVSRTPSRYSPRRNETAGFTFALVVVSTTVCCKDDDSPKHFSRCCTSRCFAFRALFHADSHFVP